jgi:hypothetical protein
MQVAFRPNTRQSYTDELELITGSSSIMVPLSAVLPASKLHLPSAVDFGCVPVRQSCMRQLPIKNVGDAGLHFSWKLQEPFAVVPASGQLVPGQTLLCEVSSCLPQCARMPCDATGPLCLTSTDAVMGSSRYPAWLWPCCPLLVVLTQHRNGHAAHCWLCLFNIATAMLPTACCACCRCTFSLWRQLLSGWQPHAAWTTGSC